MPTKQTIQGFPWKRIQVYECSYVLIAMIIFNECSYVTCHFNGRNSLLWAKLLGHRVEVLVHNWFPLCLCLNMCHKTQVQETIRSKKLSAGATYFHFFLHDFDIFDFLFINLFLFFIGWRSLCWVLFSEPPVMISTHSIINYDSCSCTL